MKACPSCGASCEDPARFCLECGHAFAESGAEPDDPWSGRVVSGRFKLARRLGVGGMGDVFLAEQTEMGRRVALKLLKQALSNDPEQVERFKREAKAASKLDHPNTIIVHDFGQDRDGTLFLAMEFLEGRTLAEVIEADGPLAPERIAHMMAQIAGSLQEAHEAGIIHRDLKPDNIFLTRRGGADDFVKVLDFGIAKLHESGTGDKLETLTRAGAIFGTPQYMSPEQIRGGGLDARSDIYALGVILYEMLAGELPFRANTAMEMLTKHLSESPRPLDGPADANGARARLEAVSMRALSKNKEDRHASVQAFLEDVMAAVPGFNVHFTSGSVAALRMAPGTGPNLAPGPTGPTIATPPSDLADTKGGSGGIVIAAVIVLLIAGGGGAWYLLGQGGSDAPSTPPSGSTALAATGGPSRGDQEEGTEEAEPAEAGEPASGAETAEPTADPEAAEAAAQPAVGEPPAEPDKAETAVETELSAEQAIAVEAEAEKAAVAAEKELAEQGQGEAPKDAAEAKAVAEKAEAERMKAEAERVRLDAETRAQAAAITAKASEQAAKEAALAKAHAEADKARAEEEAARAKAQAAKATANREAAEEALVQAAAARKAAEDAQAAASAESETLRAELDRIRAEQEAVAAAAAEAKAKAEEAKARVKAAHARKKPEATHGRLVITSGPKRGARVFIDGKFRGSTPTKDIRVKPGVRKLEVKYKGKTKKQTIKVRAGEVKRVSINI